MAMQTRLNKDGDEVFIFEEYPDIEVRPDVITPGDVEKLVPAAARFPRLVKWLMHLFEIDEVNRVHSKYSLTPGPEFVRCLMEDEFKVKLQVDNIEILDRFKEGPFITVSNHPFGALDGIILIYLVTRHRPRFRVMVNMILNKISAMRPNFIAVDQSASDDPAKRAVSVAGIRKAISMLREGDPVGFFPAGAMSKTTLHDGLQDRPWQPSILQIIHRAKVPVIPIYFHGSNSWWFNFLGHVCWPARSLRLPAEVFRKCGKEIHVSVGKPISVDEQKAHGASPEELGTFLRERTYELKKLK